MGRGEDGQKLTANTAICHGGTRQLFSQPSCLSAIEPGLGQPLCGGLDRGEESEQCENRAKHPQRKVERSGHKQQCPAAKQLQDGSGLTAFGLSEPCRAGDIFGALRNSQGIQRAAGAGPFADPADILGKPHQRTGLFDVEGGLDSAHGLAGMQYGA